MPSSSLTAHTLDVPGALLYYERRGTGPLLLMIGSPMDSTGFAGLAAALAGRYTVVTYDPRGIGNSSREDTGQDVTPGQQADDVHRLVSVLGGGPVDLFGSSGGAVVGLALVTAHPGEVRTLVAHEPPVIELLPDRDQLRSRTSMTPTGTTGRTRRWPSSWPTPAWATRPHPAKVRRGGNRRRSRSPGCAPRPASFSLT